MVIYERGHFSSAEGLKSGKGTLITLRILPWRDRSEDLQILWEIKLRDRNPEAILDRNAAKLLGLTC